MPAAIPFLIAAAANASAYYLAVGLYIAGQSVYQRRKQRKAAAKARAAYNASLTDRSVTLASTVPPLRIIYGECVTGGDIVAVFTSDQVGYKANGSPITKADGYKHLVIVLAAHEVEQIGEVYIDGVPLGPLDANGWVQSGSEFYVDEKDRAFVVDFTGSVTLPWVVAEVLSAVDGNGVAVTVTLASGNTVINGPAGVAVTVQYRTRAGEATVRCSKHAGLPTDPADPYLMSVVPDKWTADHVLRGLAYIVITLDLEQSRFQGGPPGLTASVKGRRVYDPRKDSTRGGSGSHRVNDPATWQWSNNNALCTADWLCAPWGFECDRLEDVDDAYTVAAANACDVVVPIGDGTGPTYTCNGVLMTDGSKEGQLEDLCESMAGTAVYGAQWMISAGAWTVPVGALTDDDLDGQIEIVQAGATMDELFNGVRGTHIPAGKANPIDFQPYSNATFVDADGRPLWSNIELPYTDHPQRCANVARILTERARSSQVLRYPAKLPAWRYRVGERVTVTSAEYGLTAKPYRVTDWQFGLDAPVTLILEEDAAEIWDQADAVVADPTPNTGLPSPWVVSPLASLAAASGTAHLQLQADGSITARVWVSWAAITDAYVPAGGRVRVRWLDPARREWSDAIETTGDALGVYVIGARDGDVIAIEATAINSLGVSGPPRVIAHKVLGKSQPPSDVTDLTPTIVQGGTLITWDNPADLDYLRTRIRLGSSWGVYTVEYLVTGRQLLIPWLALGSYTVHARHEDTSGNVSAGVESQAFTVDSTAQIQWASVNGRPKLYRVGAVGLSAVGAPIGAGVYDGETGATIVAAGPMWNLLKIHRSTGVATFVGAYNTLVTPSRAADLAADLNSIGNDYIVVLFTYDEPASNRLGGGLPDAMYRCGASRVRFGSTQFPFRGAYILVGIAGVGEGGGFEAMAGKVSSDPNAWCDVSFTIASGQLTGVSANATPLTLADYSYVGDLDATNGATFGVNIGGQAQTSDIAPGAATLLHQLAYPSTSVLGSGGSLVPVATLSYTAAATADNIATALGFITGNYSGVSGPTPVDVTAYMRLRRNGALFRTTVFSAASQPNPTSGAARGTFPFEETYPVTAGDVIAIELLGYGGTGFTSATVEAGNIKVEEIKR